jgi:hypothetical protein
MNKFGFVEENVIEVEVQGPQDARSVLAALDEVRTLKRYFGMIPEQTRLLIVTLDAGHIDITAVPAAITFLNALRFQAAAIVYRPGPMTAIIKTIVSHADKRQRINIFTNRQEAVAWLLSQENHLPKKLAV